MYRTGHKHWVEKMSNAPKTKYFTSWFSGISQGLDYIYMSLMVGLLWYSVAHDSGKTMIVGLTITIARMFIMFLFGWLACASFRQPMSWLKVLKNRSGWIVMFGGILGGGIGTVFSNLAVIYAGANLGGILTAIFPIFVALASRKLFKEKIKKWGWVGLILSVVSMVTISILRYMASDGEDTQNIILGLVFGLLTSITFALESVMVEWGTRNSAVEIENYASITIVGFGSSIVLLLILPFWSKIATHDWVYGFDVMNQIFTQGRTFLWILGSSTIFFLSWWAYYHAIDKMGSTDATSICVSYVIWTPIIGCLVYIPSFITGKPLIDGAGYIEASKLAEYTKGETLTFMERVGWEPFVFAPLVCIGIVMLLRNVENGIDKAPIRAPKFLKKFSKKFQIGNKISWDD